MGGIFAFAVGIIVMYSHLLEIESKYSEKDLRRGNSSNNNSIKKKTKKKVDDPNDDPRLQRNNNHRNPGRAWGSEKGKVKCDEDIHRLVSYWNDPRSNFDRAFLSPFLEAPSAYIFKGGGLPRRYLSFEPDLVSACNNCCFAVEYKSMHI